MKMKEEEINIPSKFQSLEIEEGVIAASEVIKNQAKIGEYVNSSRLHLEALKAELYKVLDAGYTTAKHYKIDQELEADFNVLPSVFLEKAFTIQTFDEQGKAIPNRNQEYINAGTAFGNYCDANNHPLNEDQLLSNDASKIIGTVNTALSVLNRLESNMNTGKYQEAGAALTSLEAFIGSVKEQAGNSQLVTMVPNQNMIQKIISGLSDLITSIRNIGKSEEQKSLEKFTSFKTKYNEVVAEQSKAAEKSSESENDARTSISMQ